MATYKSYDFSNANLDYEAVLATAQMMYSDLLHQGEGCCKSKSLEQVLCQADIFFQDIIITGDITKDTYNLDRWEEDIKDVYLILSSFFRLSAEVSPVTPVIFPDEVLDEMDRGKQYLSNLNAEYIADLKRGCNDCKPLSFECLKRLLRALDFKNELDQYDEIAEKLIEKMLIIIGGYALEVPPTVNAGADQVLQVGSPAIFTAVGTQGSAPIVSYLWTKVSGGTVNMTGTNTTVMTATGFGVGEYVFKVTATDSNGNTGSDTVKLTAVAEGVTIKYGISLTPINPNTFVYQYTANVVDGATEYTLTFPDEVLDAVYYIGIEQPLNQPDKSTWFNTTLNQGTIPDPYMNAKVVVGSNEAYTSRDVFIFDGLNTTLKLST